MARGFGSIAICRSTIQLKYLFSNPLYFFFPILPPSLLPKPSSFYDAICKVVGSRATTGPFYEIKKFPLGGFSWIHSAPLLNTIDKDVEHTRDNAVTEGSGNAKVKRKKLKGKGAVVRWLKFCRWKKKKDYERMTAEEKILYKLRKARKKEERMVEALKKIEPKESSETKHDPEILTPEEHFFILKIGQKSKNYVPVGRRGIYQGEVKEIAVEMARLSGGIVLDIQADNKIIMYRGRNYSQPPTEIMSPRTTLPRKKALDKSNYRDGLRAVRKYILRLEQDPSSCFEQQPKTNLKQALNNESQMTSSDMQTDASEKLRQIKAGKDEQRDDNEDELMMGSDSEALSDIFETDSDSEIEEKEERPLYLNEFEKFPVQNVGEGEDFEEHLHKISADSKNGKLLGKDDELPDLDEVDRMVLQAASLLKKKRR
ncbi:hypothetical protein LguiB_000553 [Lonicera macranthoides]